jgi:hypothetical protein
MHRAAICVIGRVPTNVPSATAATPCNGSVSPRQPRHLGIFPAAPAMTSMALHPTPQPGPAAGRCWRWSSALLALPFVIAAGLYFIGWQPARTGNHGHLRQSALALAGQRPEIADGRPLATAALQGKWLLLLNGNGRCETTVPSG